MQGYAALYCSPVQPVLRSSPSAADAPPNMNLLAIDTSTDTLFVAVQRGDAQHHLAALALGELGLARALPALQVAEADSDPEVRKAVRIALAQLQGAV